MAVVATFTADFSRWNEGLKNAQANLKPLEVSAKGVQRQLENMAKSFSGVNIKKEADLAVAAVKSIGGAAKLTEAEQRKVNATVTEAIAKYRALGQQAPAELRKLQAETQKVAKETGMLGSAAGKAGAMIAGAFTVGAIVGVTRKVLDLGGELSDLSSKTGIGVKALQEFKYAGGQVGVSLDAITGAVNQMQNRIAEGDKSAVGALKRLNISVADFKKLKPEDQFSAVAQAVSEIQDPAEKVRTAMDLMGKSGAELLPVLTSGFNEARESARRLGIVLDEETVAAIDTMGDRIDTLSAVGLAGFARLLVEIEPLLTSMASGFLDAGKWIDYLQDQFEFAIVGAYDLTASLAELEVELYKIADAANPVARFFGTFDDAIVDAEKRASDARLTIKLMAEGIQRDATKAAIALAKLGEVRVAPTTGRGGGGGNGPSDEEIKRFQKWREEVTGAARDKALQQLTKDWLALSAAERASQPVRDKVIAQYEKLRVDLPKVGGALESLRTANLKMIPVTQRSIDLWRILAVQVMPDAVGMFKAGQAALQQFKRDGDLVSKRLVDMAVQMKAVPVALFTKNVRAMAGEIKGFGTALKENLTDALAAVPDIIINGLLNGASAEDTAVALGSKIGSAVGASIAMALAPGNPAAAAIGEAIGALLGPLVDAVWMTRAEKTMKRVAYEFGVGISEELAQGIEDEAERQFGGNRQAAKIFNLDNIIREGGGLSSSNYQQLFARFRDLFSMVESGAFTAAHGIEVLDKNFREFADFVTSGGSLASAELLEIIALTDRFGLKSAEVSAFVVQETGKALGGLTTFLQNAKVTTQEAANGITAALFGIFEAQADNGVPVAEIIKQLDPLIKQLDQQLIAAGLSGGESFRLIKELAAVASNEIAGPLITGVLGLEQAFAGLHNAGILNEEMFDGLTASVADTYAQILATGVDGSKALQLIGPTLQTIWELQQDFGYSVDETTQALLDEAAAAGLVGEKHRTAQEQMLRLTERMTVAIEGLAELFGVDLPDAVKEFGDAIEDLPDPVITPRINWPDMEPPGGWPQGPTGEPSGYDPSTGYAYGGMVQPKYFTGGGPVGTDTVPSWLTPGEFVMQKSAVDRIGADTLSSMNRGGGSGGTTVVIEPGAILVQSLDPAQSGSLVVSALFGAIEAKSPGAMRLVGSLSNASRVSRR